ncbi:MAG TPA: 3-deoxy-7-phosphoheptulonate synthase, partial [Rhodopila sp.]
EAASRRGLQPRIMVDASHANSGKNPANQPNVIAFVAEQIAAGDHRIIGAMIESHLVAGRQDLQPNRPLIYGQSITDGCIDWETSVTACAALARAVQLRRRHI